MRIDLSPGVTSIPNYSWPYEVHAFDIRRLIDELNDIPIKTLAIDKALADLGLDVNNAYIFNHQTPLGKRVLDYREHFIDAFIAFTINDFDLCTVLNEIPLTEHEKDFFKQAETARKVLFDLIHIPDYVTGHIVRQYRIKTNLFIVAPIQG